MASFLLHVATLLLLVASSFAQTSTECQPLEANCPADPAFGMDYTFNFNTTPSSDAWVTTAGVVTYSVKNGATFTINKQGDSPTIRTSFYIFFGRTEIFMKAAPGTGIISALMLLSDDLDEIDWEFMGSNASTAETNYFGKGRKDFNNALYHPVEAGVQSDYRNYTTVWTNASLDYYVDGQKVRTLLPKDANNTNNYPQTPMRLSVGIWAGGDPSLPEGTRQWAGGTTDYSKGPFTMYIKSARITDYSSGKDYTYGDKSGTWESIKVAAGNSTAHKAITPTPPESITDKWNKLPAVAHTAIYASAAGLGAILAALALYSCIKRRRRVAKEAKLADERQARERMELEQFKKAGIDPDSLKFEGEEYDPAGAKETALKGSSQHSLADSPRDYGNRNEKPWAAAAVAGGAAAAASNGMRSPAPLLQSSMNSPVATSPNSPHGPNGSYPRPFTDAPNTPIRSASPTVIGSPMRSPGSGRLQNHAAPPQSGGPMNYQRSFTDPDVGMHRQNSGGQGRPGMSPYGQPGAAATQRSATMGSYQTPGSSMGNSYTDRGNQGGLRPYVQQGGHSENSSQNYWR